MRRTSRILPPGEPLIREAVRRSQLSTANAPRERRWSTPLPGEPSVLNEETLEDIEVCMTELDFTDDPNIQTRA